MTVKTKQNKSEELIKNVRRLMDDKAVSEQIVEPVLAGVDLGTSNLQVVVVDSERKPVAARFEWDNSVRDGVVVDFAGARSRLRDMVTELREDLGDVELEYASVGYPPGTEAWVESNVVKDVRLQVVTEVDEPSAAVRTLGIQNGAVVDIGGGTTGVSVVEDGEIIFSSDVATGGHHITLVLSGHYDMTFDEAEQFKQETSFVEYSGAVRPVVEKMASIVEEELQGFPDIKTIHLVGGTAIPKGFEDIMADELKREVLKPNDPILVTPLGIGLTGMEELNR